MGPVPFFIYSYPLKDEGFIFCITQSDRTLLISVMELIIIAVLILLISIIGGRSMPHMNTETSSIAKDIGGSVADTTSQISRMNDSFNI